MKDTDTNPVITILINNRTFVAPKPVMTGREIKQLAGEPAGGWLILSSPRRERGENDRQVQDSELIELRLGMHFRIMLPASFGGADSGIPPQLENDVIILQKEGFEVTTIRNSTEGSRIYVLFNNYKLPRGWNKATTKLLLITDISYPNSKVDMFWVDADLRLADGGKVAQSAGTIETYLDQPWQRFSWHVQRWNPALDNVITYLATVDTRLGQLQ
jgi:hypothetical protein